MSTARNEILNRLKNTVHNVPEKPDFDAPVYHSIDKPLEITFKENLEALNGSVYLCQSEEELYVKVKNLLTPFNSENTCCAETEIQTQLKNFDVPFSECTTLPPSIEVGITGCEFLIAHTGSAMVSSAQKGGRRLFVYSPLHIIIASKKQVVDYLESAYLEIQKRYKNNLPSQITLITGPSRTADIEKTLIIGAHGPKELHVFIV